MSTFPTHYRDDGTRHQGEVCSWSGVARPTDETPCGNGCSGSTEHYSNDGHPECDDSPEELVKMHAAMDRSRSLRERSARMSEQNAQWREGIAKR